MDIVETELVKLIEQEIEEYLKIQNSNVVIQVKPHLLFKPGLHLRSMPPDPNSQNRLFDRICCVRSGFSVPLGAKGTIIGIRKASNPADIMYDVLFDQPFIGKKRPKQTDVIKRRNDMRLLSRIEFSEIRNKTYNVFCLTIYYYRRTYVKRLLCISWLSFSSYGLYKYQFR